METPIVLLVFNRPETTMKVFDAVKKAQPKRLFVVADGPREDSPGEAEKCCATRSVFNRVDWDCEVLTNYSDINLGCGVRVSTGIDWVFSRVEEAIFLEDDCLPHPHFFDFCEKLLERYRNDSRVMHISGNQHLLGWKQNFKYSYYFSRYPLIWGWASWRRAWKHYDFQMTNFPKLLKAGWLKKYLNNNKREVYVWTNKFQSVCDNPYTWDYQWIFSCWMQEGLSIHPEVNLVSNIGFSPRATHTQDSNNPWANIPIEPLTFPLRHPASVSRNIKIDRYLQNTQFDPSKLNRLKMQIRKILG